MGKSPVISPISSTTEMGIVCIVMGKLKSFELDIINLMEKLTSHPRDFSSS